MNRPFGEEGVPPEKARFVLVPVPYERTTTYRRGTMGGPAALLAAGTQVELYDEETGAQPLEAGVAVLPPVSTRGMPDELADVLRKVVRPHLAAGRVVGCLGGEHSISLGPLQAAARVRKGLGILHVDAHPDLRDEYEGTRFGHGCVMRRVLEEKGVARLVQVGLRAVSAEDHAAIEGDKRVRPFYAHDLARREPAEWIGAVLAELPPRIYVSFDVDGLDPSVVPGTGTPEPGGLSWWGALALLRAALAQRELVGFDIVELLPVPHSQVSDFAAAKLLFKMLSYAVARK
ncbi:MAG TPA: agmatinase [Planctomycetota bacterium]|nr:agmatinase [Planctomycetota bacterium]